MIEMILTDIEARILGSLIEKALSTPEYYPLSLNALTNACNQKSSREPVTAYTETEIQQAAGELVDKGLIHLSQAGRVPKYEELFSRERKFVPRETAILAVLLLRGAQTAGEIRSRTVRMCEFASPEEVLSTLADLEGWGLVRRLERQAGHKEPRYQHSMAPEPAPPDLAAPASVDRPQPHSAERMAALEARMALLEDAVAELKSAFRDFRAQFE
jgi:uncharacterized protein